MNHGAKILAEVIDILKDYKIISSKDLQTPGDLFEQLLDKGFKQNEGQFFTPIPIAHFIFYTPPEIIDYACGAGHFLTEGFKAVNDCFARKNLLLPVIRERGKLFGVEKDDRLARVCENFAVHARRERRQNQIRRRAGKLSRQKYHACKLLASSLPIRFIPSKSSRLQGAPQAQQKIFSATFFSTVILFLQKIFDGYLKKTAADLTERDREKIIYFGLTYRQGTLIVSAPDKNDEQEKFLGYDRSNNSRPDKDARKNFSLR